MITFQNALQIGGVKNFHSISYSFNSIDAYNSQLSSHELSIIDASNPCNRLYERFDRSIGLQEKHPFYVLGEKLRPIVNLGFNAVKALGEVFIQAAKNLDGKVDKIFQVFPGAEACEIAERGFEKACAVAHTSNNIGIAFRTSSPREYQLLVLVAYRCESVLQLAKKWNLKEEVHCIDRIEVATNETSPFRSIQIVNFLKRFSMGSDLHLLNGYAIDVNFRQIQNFKTEKIIRVDIKIAEVCLKIFADQCSWYEFWSSCKNVKAELTKRTKTVPFRFIVTPNP